MTRTMLIATVAALAITAPAQAQDRGKGSKRGEQAEKQGGGERAEVPQRAQERAPRVERQERAQRQERAPRVERPAERQERAPRIERQVERQERAPRMERRVERQERAPRVERRIERQERAPRIERRVERQERAPRVERRVAERKERAPRAERQIAERSARQAENRAEATNRTVERRARQAENRVEAADRTIVRRARQAENRAEATNRTVERRERQADNRAFRQERRADQPVNNWENLVQRRAVRIEDSRPQRLGERSIARIGERVEVAAYDDNVPFVYRARYQDTPEYFYRYNDDGNYLYQVSRDTNLVSALVPLLGGAYSVGSPLPLSYSSYNVPYGYRSLYYDTPDNYYRYGSGAIYQVDSGTNLLQAIVALLAGQSFGVGQMLPASYSTYNVPYDYRDQYYDTADNWYRYNDGSIYQIDPRTRLIEDVHPLAYDGFAIGSPMPYGYDDYNVPYGYRDLYYDTPDYNYRYANNGIYQVDPTTQMIQALVALVSGQNYNVGQAMPASYGVYNVPYDYRDRYADSDDSWYRYNDGTIYELDPQTRIVRDTHYIYA